MKKFPKLVQCDKRGQIVIPKDIRSELKIDEGTGFWMYAVTNEGILLKKVDAPPLSKQEEIVDEVLEKSDKIGMDKETIKKSIDQYEKTTDGNLEVL